MAEAIARDAIERSLASRAGASRGGASGDADLFVASAGVSAADGAPITPEALQTLRALGIEHLGSSKRLTAEMVRRADAVFSMTEAHAEAARALVAGDHDAEAKILRLDPSGDIEDPIGLGPEAYDAVAQRLRAIVPARLAEIRRRGTAASRLAPDAAP